METVFNHNITEAEKKAIGIVEKTETDYLKNVGKDSALTDLAFLYSHRNDNDKAEHYANQLPDQMKLDCLRTIYHP